MAENVCFANSKNWCVVMEDETIKVGTNVVKQFVDVSGKIIGLFRGHISEIDGDESDGSVLYRIVYEDGDSEDLDEKECLECIELDMKLESGEINEWEIDGER